MDFRSTLGGALRHEFRMQVRRKAMWVIAGFLGLLTYLVWYGNASDYLTGFYVAKDTYLPPSTTVVLVNGRPWVPPSPTTAVLYWAVVSAMFLPLAVGLVLADRLVRDRQTHVDELLQTTSGSLGARLFGKYLGATLATVTPLLVVYALGTGYMLSRGPDGHALAVAVVAFPLLLGPSCFFVAGFSVAVPAILKVPIYQFLFIGYWFWGNLLGTRAGIPTWSDTLLNASGQWAAHAILKFDLGSAGLKATPAQALANIALLLVLGLVAMLCADRYLRWRQAAQ
jgi:hypothetical protein